MAFEEVFESRIADRIRQVLPSLFNMVELECRRGEKLGMEVGTARERVLIALFMYVYGNDAVTFPPTTSSEVDVFVNKIPVSIKTKMNAKSGGGVKLVWTIDWAKVEQFISEYQPTSHILFVNITWDGEGGFYLIDKKIQREIRKELGLDYFKVPPQGTNPRGVEMSKDAMIALQNHETTQSIMLNWKRNPNVLTERHLYGRWVDLWNGL